MITDLSPFTVAEDNLPTDCRLVLKKKNKTICFFLYRVAPWIIMICTLFVAGPLREAAGQLVFSIYGLLMFGASIWLLIYRYPVELSFSAGRFDRKINVFYFTFHEEEALNGESVVEVKKVRGNRSAAWVFSLQEDSKRKRLFHIPIVFTENKKSRDNFILLFREVSGVRNIQVKE